MTTRITHALCIESFCFIIGLDWIVAVVNREIEKDGGAGIERVWLCINVRSRKIMQQNDR